MVLVKRARRFSWHGDEDECENTPDELLLHIFSFVTPTDLRLRVLPTCRRWRRLSQDPSLWLEIDMEPHNDVVDDAVMVRTLTHAGQLRKLNLLNCRAVTDHTLVWLASLTPHLTSVNLCNANVTDTGVQVLSSGCRKLQVIKLGFCPITDLSLIYLSMHCPALTFVNVRGCEGVTDIGLGALAQNCSHLTHCHFGLCNITDTGLGVLAKGCHELARLNVGWCKSLTNASLEYLGQYCPELSHVDFGWCVCVSDVGVSQLAEHCQRLKEVKFTGPITDQGVHNLASHCHNLTRVDLGGCTQITDGSLLELARYCRQLKALDVGGCGHVSDTGLKFLTQECHDLTRLDLSGCDLITNEALHMLADQCHHLHHVDLGGCSHITDLGVLYLQACHELRSLDLHSTHVTRRAVQALRHSIPCLRSVHLTAAA